LIFLFQKTEPALREAQEKAKIQQWEAERSKKAGVNILKAKYIGCIWDSSDKLYEELEKYKMVQLAFNLPIQCKPNTNISLNDQSIKSSVEDTPKQNKNSKSQQQSKCQF
jgi:uncharacterized membrane protein YbjE (DUF340 family)